MVEWGSSSTSFGPKYRSSAFGTEPLSQSLPRTLRYDYDDQDDIYILFLPRSAQLNQNSGLVFSQHRNCTMLWLKSKRTQNAKAIELQPKCQNGPDRPENREETSINDKETSQYPGMKVIVPTVLSICLSTFLSALVSPPNASPLIAIHFLPSYLGSYHCRRCCPLNIKSIQVL